MCSFSCSLSCHYLPPKRILLSGGNWSSDCLTTHSHGPTGNKIQNMVVLNLDLHFYFVSIHFFSCCSYVLPCSQEVWMNIVQVFAWFDSHYSLPLTCVTTRSDLVLCNQASFIWFLTRVCCTSPISLEHHVFWIVSSLDWTSVTGLDREFYDGQRTTRGNG